MADCMVLVHLNNHRRDVGKARRRISLRWKPSPMPGLQVKYIDVHVPGRVLVAWMVDQHKGLVSNDRHAAAELR